MKKLLSNDMLNLVNGGYILVNSYDDLGNLLDKDHWSYEVHRDDPTDELLGTFDDVYEAIKFAKNQGVMAFLVHTLYYSED